MTSSENTIEITVNGESKNVPGGLNLPSLLAHLEIPAARVAIERNRSIVRKPDWEATEIVSGDQLEIVWFVGGGRL